MKDIQNLPMGKGGGAMQNTVITTGHTSCDRLARLLLCASGGQKKSAFTKTVSKLFKRYMGGSVDHLSTDQVENLCNSLDALCVETLYYNDIVGIYHALVCLATSYPRKMVFRRRAFHILKGAQNEREAFLELVELQHLDPFSPENVSFISTEIKSFAETKSDQYISLIVDNYEEMLAYFNKPERQITVLLLMGWMCLQEKKLHDRAFDCVAQAHRLDPASDAITTRLERVAEQTGHLDQLRHYYSLAESSRHSRDKTGFYPFPSSTQAKSVSKPHLHLVDKAV